MWTYCLILAHIIELNDYDVWKMYSLPSKRSNRCETDVHTYTHITLLSYSSPMGCNMWETTVHTYHPSWVKLKYYDRWDWHSHPIKRFNRCETVGHTYYITMCENDIHPQNIGVMCVKLVFTAITLVILLFTHITLHVLSGKITKYEFCLHSQGISDTQLLLGLAD